MSVYGSDHLDVRVQSGGFGGSGGEGSARQVVEKVKRVDQLVVSLVSGKWNDGAGTVVVVKSRDG